LLTDTGSFHYSNTTERTFKIASELVRIGVKPAKTAEAIFGSYEWPKIELLSHVLSTAKRDATGHVAWMWQTIAMQEQTRAAEEDADGFVNYPWPWAKSKPPRSSKKPHPAFIAPACARKVTSTSPRSPSDSAAAVTATPPAARSKATVNRSSSRYPATAGRD
jgi:hypothetical protein